MPNDFEKCAKVSFDDDPVVFHYVGENTDDVDKTAYTSVIVEGGRHAIRVGMIADIEQGKL